VAFLLSFILSPARGLAQTINAAPVESVLDGTQECPWSSFPGSGARRSFVIPYFFLRRLPQTGKLGSQRESSSSVPHQSAD